MGVKNAKQQEPFSKDKLESWTLTAPVRLLWILASAIIVSITDFYIPATPAMATYFGVSRDLIQCLVPVYFLAVALMALIAGFVADKIGSIPVLRLAFLLLCCGSLVCAFSQKLVFVFVGRAIQGLGTGFASVIVLSLIRTYYPGEYAAKILAQTGMVFISAPFVAQWVASQANYFMGWQACFGVTAFLCLAFLILSHKLLLVLREKEQTTSKSTQKASLLLAAYAESLKNKRGLALILLQPLILGGIWCYRSSLPFILIETYGVSELMYSYYLLPMVGTHLLFSYLAQHFVVRFGSQHLIQKGILLLILGGLFEVFLWALDWVTPVTFTLAFLPFVAGYSISLSTGMATGVGRFKMTSFASSLTVCMRMIGGAFGGAFASYFNESSILGLTLFILVTAPVTYVLSSYAFPKKKEGS